VAAPFVQGRLRDEYLAVEIETQCAHCGKAMHVDIDSELKYRVRERDARPLMFEPRVDWDTFEEPNIIHAY
jgi:hypothetical protein